MSECMIECRGGAAVVHFDLRIYDLDSIQRAAHRFTRDVVVSFERDGQGENVRCRLRPRQSLVNIEHIAGEFVNEVLDQQLRARLATRTETIRNLLLAQAFSKVNLMHPELDTAEPTDAPASVAEQDRP